MSVDLRPVLYKAEALLLEQSLLATAGPQFRVLHRFNIAGTLCQAGEEVFAVFLLHRGQEILVRLPLALRLLFDYLGHHRHLGQSSSQIAAGIRASSFYRNHGMNSGEPSRRLISRSAVKEYVLRIRRALEVAIRDTDGSFNSCQILVSEQCEGNEVLYRLRATVQWLHTEEIPAKW